MSLKLNKKTYKKIWIFLLSFISLGIFDRLNLIFGSPVPVIGEGPNLGLLLLGFVIFQIWKTKKIEVSPVVSSLLYFGIFIFIADAIQVKLKFQNIAGLWLSEFYIWSALIVLGFEKIIKQKNDFVIWSRYLDYLISFLLCLIFFLQLILEYQCFGTIKKRYLFDSVFGAYLCVFWAAKILFEQNPKDEKNQTKKIFFFLLMLLFLIQQKILGAIILFFALLFLWVFTTNKKRWLFTLLPLLFVFQALPVCSKKINSIFLDLQASQESFFQSPKEKNIQSAQSAGNQVRIRAFAKSYQGLQENPLKGTGIRYNSYAYPCGTGLHMHYPIIAFSFGLAGIFALFLFIRKILLLCWFYVPLHGCHLLIPLFGTGLFLNEFYYYISLIYVIISYHNRIHPSFPK